MKPRTVQLIDGPLRGELVPAHERLHLYLEDERLPDRRAAWYAITSDPREYRFVQLVTVTERLEQVA